MLIKFMAVGSLGARQTTFAITHWDEYELDAEDASPQCEKDKLVFNRQEKSVTVTSVPTYKDDSCTKEFGPPKTVVYHLIDGVKLGATRETDKSNQVKLLYQLTPEARAIFNSKD
jgi:hypothetical protein